MASDFLFLLTRVLLYVYILLVGGSTTQTLDRLATIIVLLYVLCACLTVFYNVFVLYTVFKVEGKKKLSSNLYMLSLFGSQLLVGAVVIPAHIWTFYAAHDHTGGFFACRLMRFVSVGCSLVSVFSVAIIATRAYKQAMDIDLNIGSHSDHTSRQNEEDEILSPRGRRRSSLGQSAKVAGVWIIAFLYATRALVGTDHVYDSRAAVITNTCATPRAYLFIEKYFAIVDLCFGFVGPFAVILNCYARVVEKMSLMASRGYLTSDQSFYTLKMCVCYIIMFCITTLGSNIMNMISLWYGSSTELAFGGAFAVVYGLMDAITGLCSYCASWLGVVVVCYYTQSYRIAFKSSITKVPGLKKCFKLRNSSFPVEMV